MRRTAFVAAALALPLLVARASLHRGHHADQAMFARWYGETRDAPSRLYLTPRHDVNYPVLGAALAVAPGLVLAGRHGALPSARAFEAAGRWLLVPWCTLLLVAFAGCAGTLGLTRPRLRALAWFVLPSTWAGGLWFGQIDAATCALQLLSAWCGARFVLASWHTRPDARAWASLAGALVALDASLLSKQLALFAAPALLALPAAGLVRLALRGRRRAALIGLFALLAAIALLHAPDAWLALPSGWRWHVIDVFFLGPAHRSQLANAPGLFALLGLFPGETALDPLVSGITPWTLGLGLYAFFLALLALMLAFRARALLRADDSFAPRRLVATLLLLGGLMHLGMATLLTAAHDRYPFHAMPLLLLSLGARANDASGRAVHGFAWLAAGLYGALVFSQLEWDALGPMARVLDGQRVAAVLLVLLVSATVLFARDPDRRIAILRAS